MEWRKIKGGKLAIIILKKKKIMIAVYKYIQANSIRIWICEHRKEE